MMHASRTYRKATILLIALGVTCSLGFRAQKKSVAIKEMKFVPDAIEIKVGDTVTWTNNDDRDHTVVADDGSFKSDNLRPGASYSFQFTKAGKFSYACSYPPRMKGSVTVTDK